MRAVALCLIALYFLSGCEQSGGDSADLSGSKPDPIIIGQENLASMDGGIYVLDGSAHPTLWGDIIEIDGDNYERVHWVNGVMIKETGTVTYRQVIDIEEKGATVADVHTIYNYIECHPSSFTPSNCGYSFDSYEHGYVYETNGSVTTQMVDFDVDRWHQAFGWTLDVDWADANLTAGCL